MTASERHCPHCDGEHPARWSHCPNTGHALLTGPALVGQVIANRYRVGDVLGEGGMGAVYAAQRIHDGREVALKRLHPELASDAAAVRRFQREARAAGATGHPNVVEIYDLGFAEDGAPYLTMERLYGESLSIRMTRPFRPSEAVDIVLQALDGLAAVHACGVIHRDLKPDNMYLVDGDELHVKLLDFGVSKMRSSGDLASGTLTRTGATMGTPQYMSPEQARGMRVVDHRVDLYALGVILYQALGGHLPFTGSNYHALLQAILSSDAPRLATLTPELDAGLCAVVERAMSRRAADRYDHAKEMWTALRPFATNPDALTVPDPFAIRSPRPSMTLEDDSPRQSHTRVRESAPPYGDTDSVPSVKGSFVLALQAALVESHGDETWATHVGGIEALEGLVLAVGWLPQKALETLVERATSSTADATRLGVDTGRLLLPRAHRVTLSDASPRTFAARMPQIHSAYFDTSELTVDVRDDHHRLTFRRTAVHPRLMAVLAGFYRAALELAGAERVNVEVDGMTIRLSA